MVSWYVAKVFSKCLWNIIIIIIIIIIIKNTNKYGVGFAEHPVYTTDIGPRGTDTEDAHEECQRLLCKQFVSHGPS